MMLASFMVLLLIIFIALAIGWLLGFYLVGPAVDDWLDDRKRR